MPDKLVLIRGQQAGAEYELKASPVLLGSDQECTVALPDEGVLAKHAQLDYENGYWMARAFDAAHPIDCGGRFLMEMRLDHGATFNLGMASLRFITPRATIESAPLQGEEPVDKQKAIAMLDQVRRQVLGEVGKVVIGQHAVINQVLTALFARGHCLLVGAPGLAKTLLVRTLAGTLDLDSKRIQFTPDLMPADITGADILEEDTATGRRRFRFNRGPLFTNMLLADEINRTPPKTQAALLEAMQERRVTASGMTQDLPQPFLVLATQNPIELEGTYPLPEAQLDRFMFCIHVDYPAEEEETRIIMETTRDRVCEVDRVLDARAILQFQHLLRQIPVSEHVARYAAALVRCTRPGEKQSPDFINQWVRWGAGPRAGQYLLLAAKAHVVLNGRVNVSCADVRVHALPVLRHRIFRNFAAASEGVDTDEIVRRVIETVREPGY